jgi:hypothetical protein
MSDAISDVQEENKREEKAVRNSSKKTKSAPWMELSGVTTAESSSDWDEDEDLVGAAPPDLARLMKRIERIGRAEAEYANSERDRARGEAAAERFEEGNWQWNSQYGDLLPWLVLQLDLASSVKLILKLDGQSAPVVLYGRDADCTHEIVLRRSSVANLEHYYPEGEKPEDFPGDGDCFYRAFLYCLLGYANADAISDLRTSVVNYVRANPKKVGEKLYDRYFSEDASASDKPQSILKKPGSYEESRQGGASQNKRLVFGAVEIVDALPESLVGRRKRIQAEERIKLRILQENFHPERTRRRLAAEYEANRLVDQASRESRSIRQQLKDLSAWFKDVLHYGGSGHRQGFEDYRISAEAIEKIDDVLLSDKAGLEIELANVRARNAGQRYRGAVLAREVSIAATRIEETERALIAQKDPAGDDFVALYNKIKNSRIVSAEGKTEQERINDIRKKKKEEPSAQERLDEAKYFYRLFAETFATRHRTDAAWLGASSLVVQKLLEQGRLQPLNDFAKSLQDKSSEREDEKAAAFFKKQEEKDTKFEDEWANQQAEEVRFASSSSDSIVADMNAFLAQGNATVEECISGALFSARPADPAETSARSPGQPTKSEFVPLKTMLPVGAGVVANELLAGAAGAAPLLRNARPVVRNGRRTRARGNGSGRSRMNALFWLAIGAIAVAAVAGLIMLMYRLFSGSIARNASSPDAGDAGMRTSEGGAASVTETVQDVDVTLASSAHSQDLTGEPEQATGGDLSSSGFSASERTTRLAEGGEATAVTDRMTETSRKTEDDLDHEMQGDAPRIDEDTKRRLGQMLQRQVLHEYRINRLPAATAYQWGTVEGGGEAGTDSISHVGGTTFVFGHDTNQTVSVEKKPGHSWTYFTVPGWTGTAGADMRDMIFCELIKKGYALGPRIWDSKSSKYQARIKISKAGEADSTIRLDGDKKSIDRIIDNLKFLHRNFVAFFAALHGQPVARYRQYLEEKIEKVFLSKERSPVILKKKNEVLVVDRTPVDQDTDVKVTPLNDGYKEQRGFDFLYLFNIGFRPDSPSVSPMSTGEGLYKMSIIFKKDLEKDIRFHIYSIDMDHCKKITTKISAQEKMLWELSGLQMINAQLLEENVMRMDSDTVIETSSRVSSVIHIPEYSEEPPYKIGIRVFNPSDVFIFPRHPKGKFEFELMNLGDDASGEKIADNRVINVLHVSDIDKFRLNLIPSQLNKPSDVRNFVDPKSIAYTHSYDNRFGLTVKSEDHEESVYRHMEKQIERQIVRMAEAEFEMYQWDTSLFAPRVFTTMENLNVTYVISRNRKNLYITLNDKNDHFALNELQKNVTFLISNERGGENRKADVLLGVSLTDPVTAVKTEGSEEYFMKVFRDNYSGANITITTGNLNERGRGNAERDRMAVRALANGIESSALKRKAEIPQLIISLSSAASVVLNDDESRQCCAFWDALPEWAQDRAMRFHARYRGSFPDFTHMDDGTTCPEFSIIRDALILVKDDFIQNKQEEINWSDFPRGPLHPSDATALYRIKIIPKNKSDISNYAGARYWSAMSRSEAEGLKLAIEKSGASVVLEFAIENWVDSASKERGKWIAVTQHFSDIADTVRRSHPDDATALDALLKRMNGESGGEHKKFLGPQTIGSYPSSDIDSISEKEIRDELYFGYQIIPDLKTQHSRRHDLINGILLLGAPPKTNDHAPEEIPAKAPDEPVDETAGKPDDKTPVEPVGETPVKPDDKTSGEPDGDIPFEPEEETSVKPDLPPDTLVPVEKPAEDPARKLPKWVLGVTAVAGGGLVISGTYWGANALLKSSLGTLARLLRLGGMSAGFVLLPTVTAGVTSAASAALFGAGLVGVLKALGINVTKEMLRRALFVEIGGCGTLIIFSTSSATDAIQRAINTSEGQDILDAVARSMAAGGGIAVCAAGAGGLAKGGQLGFVHRIRSYDDIVTAAGYTGGGLTAASGATDILQCLMGYCQSGTDAATVVPPQQGILSLPDFAMVAADDKWAEKTGGGNISMSVDAEGKLYPLPDDAAQTRPGNDDGQEKKPDAAVKDPQKKPAGAPADPNPPTGSVPQDSSFLGSLWASIRRLLSTYGGPAG